MRLRSLPASAAVLVSLFAGAPALAGPCENLVLNLGGPLGTTVVGAVSVPGPAFTAVDGATYTGVPAFCKVSAVLTPTADSFINVELWMPTSTWNGKFQGIGNGGYAGTIAAGVPAMISGLQAGFAVATTDMGTAPSGNNNGDVLIGHPQKWIDWGWRSTHLMTTTAKQLIRTYYGQGPRWSYFNGCSTGGQQALMSAQRYPDDYDGILGGDPANNRTHVHTAALWNYQATRKTPQSLFLTTGQTQAMTKACVAACAVKSGGLATDPFLTDPRTCDWDPASMQCTGAPDGTCLTAEQVTAARAIYAGPRNPASGRQIYPGPDARQRAGRPVRLGRHGHAGRDAVRLALQVGVRADLHVPELQLRHRHGDPGLDPRAEPQRQQHRPLGFQAAAAARSSCTTAGPTRSPRRRSRSTTTSASSPRSRRNGTAVKNVQSFYRLFMVPGMYHCAYGPGPNAFGNPFSGLSSASPPLAPRRRARHLHRAAGLGRARHRADPRRRRRSTSATSRARRADDAAALRLPAGREDTRAAATRTIAASFVCAPAAGQTDPAQVPAPEYVN